MSLEARDGHWAPLAAPLDHASATPLRTQLEARLRGLIQRGALPRGARVPGARALAADMGVSRVTVTTAYEQLVAEGYLESAERRSTRVARDLPADGFDELARAEQGEGAFPSPNPWAPLRPVTTDVPPPGADIDLGPESFSLAGLDAAAWGRRLLSAWREVAAEPGGQAVSYFGGLGDPVLRRALASHLAVHRGVRAGPDDIAITSGSIAALSAIARTWLGPGRTCVVEEPGGEQLRRSMASAGATLIPVPVDADGLVVDELPDHADVAFVTPSWQYPNGGRLPIARRLALLDWARRVGCLVVEDDCEGEIRHDGDTTPSLQGLAEPGRVVYVNTFSKILFPGLRTGYVVVPERHRGPLLAALEGGARPPAAVEQRALGRFVESGAYRRHVRRLRTTLASRRATFASALERSAGGSLRVRPGQAGGHLIVDLVGPVSATTIVRSVAERGVRVESLAANRLSPGREDGAIVVYLTCGSEADLAEAAARLVEAALATAAAARGAPAAGRRPGRVSGATRP